MRLTQLLRGMCFKCIAVNVCVLAFCVFFLQVEEQSGKRSKLLGRKVKKFASSFELM